MVTDGSGSSQHWWSFGVYTASIGTLDEGMMASNNTEMGTRLVLVLPIVGQVGNSTGLSSLCGRRDRGEEMEEDND